MSEVILAPFRTDDEAGLEQLLAAAELPTEDLNAEILEDFLIARAGALVVGAAGIAHYKNVALLRSMAVEESHRGTGLGKRLVAAMETRARDRGVRHLYLLTTTAERFFAGLGYRTLTRDVAPDVIRATAQFSELCPVSSIFMMKELN